MENTTQGKKPAEWFAQLKEPYRSEAIENINSERINSIYKSISDALGHTFTWVYTPQGDKQWADIHQSITAGETTYLEPELIGNTDNLKPEQMESGKWYVVFTKDLFTEWLIKFDSIQENRKVIVSKCYDLTDNYDWTSPCNSSLSNKHDIKSIRPATNEEVLKYFDEKFEQQNQIEPEKIETDWKAKFEELHKDYDNLNFTYQNFMKIYEEQDLAYDALADKFFKLELQQNNQEKVYIHYNSKQEKWLQADTLQLALEQSPENKNIYEAVKIGVKKSILVNENS